MQAVEAPVPIGAERVARSRPPRRGARRSTGSRSFGGFSHQSTSPLRSAAAAVPGSGMIMPFDAVEMHALRPGGAARRAARRAGRRRRCAHRRRGRRPRARPPAKRKGPLPIISGSGGSASVCARCAPASRSSAEGRACQRIEQQRRSAASGGCRRCGRRAPSSPPTRAIMAWPSASRCAQRRMEATQSRARTGSPSWNSRPSRRREAPGQAVVLELVALDHLRLRRGGSHPCRRACRRPSARGCA